jgi:hypothetical protein
VGVSCGESPTAFAKLTGSEWCRSMVNDLVEVCSSHSGCEEMLLVSGLFARNLSQQRKSESANQTQRMLSCLVSCRDLRRQKPTRQRLSDFAGHDWHQAWTPSAAHQLPSSCSSCSVSTVPSSLSHPQLVAPVCFRCGFLSRSPSTICTGCKCFNFAGKALLLIQVPTHDIDDTFRLHHLATSHWTGSYWPSINRPLPAGYSCPWFGSCD